MVTRAVAMVRACLPKLQKETLELLFEEGYDCEETTGGRGGDGEACEREVAWAMCQSGLLLERLLGVVLSPRRFRACV